MTFITWIGIADKVTKWISALSSWLRLPSKVTASFSPQDIMKSIDAVPVLQKPAIHKHFIGHRVIWPAILKKVESDPIESSYAVLEFSYHDPEYGREVAAVRCKLKWEQHHELKDFKAERSVLLFGKIDSISNQTITLAKAEVTFLTHY